MSHLDSSTLATYNSLVDPHLQCYFSNERIRSHLRHAGLISRRGEIVSDSEYRLKAARREHKKHVRQMLAENIVHRAIDMERARQAHLKQEFDVATKAAIVNSVKESRRRAGYSSLHLSNSNDAGLISLHSSLSQSRPKSANHDEQIDTMDEESEEQPRVSRVHSAHVSGDHRPKYTSKSPTRRRRQLNRTKASSSSRPRSPTKQSDPPCQITMIYYGPHTKVDYDHSLFEPVDEIIVMQQHCGGENLIVYKANLKAGEEFTFNSRRHADFPFGLSLYVKGLIDSRISTCCEYKHRHGVRLGGERGHFAIVSVEGSKPCVKCIFEKQAKFKQYGDSPKDKNDTDDENKKPKPITISLPVSDKPKTKHTPVKIPVRRTPESDEKYSEDFDGSESAEKPKPGYSSESKDEKLKSQESSVKARPAAPRLKSLSESSEASTERSEDKSSTKTWQIIFHTSNVPNGSFQLPKKSSGNALLKISYRTAINGKDETEIHEINMKDFPQYFKSGQQDSFPVKFKNIGQPKQIRLNLDVQDHDNKENIKWHLDFVELIDPETNSHYKFPCKEWIHPSNEKLLNESKLTTRKNSTSSKSSSSSSTKDKRFPQTPPKLSSRSSSSSSSSYDVSKRFEVVPKVVRRISVEYQSDDQANKVPYRITIYPSKDDLGEFNALTNSRIFVRLNNQTKDAFIHKKESKYCPSFESGEKQTFEINLGDNVNEKPTKLTIGYFNTDIAAGKWKLEKIVLINSQTGEETVFLCNEPLVRDDLSLRAERTFQAQVKQPDSDDDKQSTPRNVNVVKESPSRSESKDTILQKPVPAARKQSSSPESPQQVTTKTTPEKLTSEDDDEDNEYNRMFKKKDTDEKQPPQNLNNDDDEDNEYNRVFKNKDADKNPELDASSSRPKTRRGLQGPFGNGNEQNDTSNKAQTNSEIWRPSSAFNNKEPVDPLIGLDDLQNQTARSNDQKNPSSTKNESENQFKDWYPKDDDEDDD